jgi:hypothetical protein
MRGIDTLLTLPLTLSSPEPGHEPRHRGEPSTALAVAARPAWVSPVMRIWGRSLLEAGAAIGLLAIMVFAHRHLG